MIEPQDFLQYVVSAVVEYPQDVEVVTTKDSEGTLLTLKVNPIDMGKVIGKKGQNIDAIKSLVRAVSKDNGRCSVKLYDPTKEEESTTFPIEETTTLVTEEQVS